jgi:hypothetical protein
LAMNISSSFSFRLKKVLHETHIWRNF